MPHSPEVAAALEASIEKWKKNATVADLEDARMNVGDCPLCALFYSDGCEGCPVFSRTNCGECRATPYEDASKWGRRGRLEQFQDAARQEVAFLESLRDPE